ncbi:sensor histidine kinase [Coraliomargarita parva]|uniref:sensor histidine kinase n=1 Tax=Coraliomargarita parva TaxID=3014050 RepID=UPI0022B4CAD0|nr:HAMP domain-containing sensor histidine kinase [Coraliomargarita parva]
MFRFWHSIQWRIFAYYTGLIALSLCVLVVAFYTFQKREHDRITELRLQQSMIGIIPFFFSPNDAYARPGSTVNSGANRVAIPQPRLRPQGMGPNLANLRPPDTTSKPYERRIAELVADEQYLFVARDQDDYIAKTDNFPDELLPIETLRGQIEANTPWTYITNGRQHYLVHHIGPHGIMVIGKSSKAVAAEVNRLLLRACLISLAILILTSTIGFWIIRRGLLPIRQISQTSERIAAGDFEDRIDTRNVRSELGQLADILNRTFARLASALQRQIQFTSDASHELRTPVAAILADCQYSLKRERSPERYRETIEICHESAQHMRELIEGLRELADFDEKAEVLVSDIIDLEDFLAGIRSLIAPLINEKEIVLSTDLQSVLVRIDPMRMKQAVINLLNNAARYTPEKGRIDLSCGITDNMAVIEIRDSGIGIQADKLPYIFDRFYRTDDARNTHTGGAGLGLAITQTIVKANEGRIQVESEVGKGTCFRIELPVVKDLV